MYPRDLDQAAIDVRNAVQSAVETALSPLQYRSVIFLQAGERIAALAEQFIRELPDKVRVGQPL